MARIFEGGTDEGQLTAERASVAVVGGTVDDEIHSSDLHLEEPAKRRNQPPPPLPVARRDTGTDRTEERAGESFAPPLADGHHWTAIARDYAPVKKPWREQLTEIPVGVLFVVSFLSTTVGVLVGAALRGLAE